jgi:hypothetical protein
MLSLTELVYSRKTPLTLGRLRALLKTCGPQLRINQVSSHTTLSFMY